MGHNVDCADHVRALGDEELLLEVRRWVSADRQLTARLLVHLGEVDARGLYRERAFGSMFDYAVRELNMSEAEAYVRIRAARVGRAFPLALELLGRGELHLTAIKLLGPLLTEENHRQLLMDARAKSKQALEVMLAALTPKPDVPGVIRRLPERRAGVDLGENTSGAAQTDFTCIGADLLERASGCHTNESTLPGSNPVAMGGSTTPLGDSLAFGSLGGRCTGMPTSAATPASACDRTIMPSGSPAGSTSGRPNHPTVPAAAVPSPAARATSGCSSALSPGRYRVQFTADQKLHDKLEHARCLLRHQVPDGDLATIVAHAMDALIAERMKQRFAQHSKARARKAGPRRVPGSRHVPHEIRRAVLERDGEQCTYVREDGQRCRERGHLEFHHILAFALGGETSVDNITTVCRAHNSLFAERDFGRSFMQRRRSAASRTATP